MIAVDAVGFDFIATSWVWVFLIFVRMAAFSSLLPGFGERSVPMRIKLGIAFGFTVILAPLLGPEELETSLPFAIVAEGITGLIFGVSVRLFVFSLQIAGVMAAQSTSLSQLMGGAAADPMPAIGHVMVIAGVTLAIISGLHIKAVSFLAHSYELVPLGVLPRAGMFSEWGLHRVATSFSLAFSLAAPFVILSVIYNLTLGAINKAMPQLMVAFVGAPLITAGGLILLLLSAPVALSSWLSVFDSFLFAPTSGL